MKIKVGFIIFFIIISGFTTIVEAQDHSNTWFRTTISVPINSKFKSDFELQHRRQNDFESSNMFEKNLMFAFRTWIYYKQNENVVYAISPFAYFSNYKIIQKAIDANLKPTNEYRFTASVELQNKLANKFFIIDRTALEYRVFEGATQNVIRLRNRLGLKYDFTSKFNTTIGDEILINASGTNSQHIFDHNRLFANLSFKPKSSLKFDLGYIYIDRLPKSNINLLTENNFYLNFTYTIQVKHNSIL